MAKLEFELAYYDVTAQLITHYSEGPPTECSIVSA